MLTAIRNHLVVKKKAVNMWKRRLTYRTGRERSVIRATTGMFLWIGRTFATLDSCSCTADRTSYLLFNHRTVHYKLVEQEDDRCGYGGEKEVGLTARIPFF